MQLNRKAEKGSSQEWNRRADGFPALGWESPGDGEITPPLRPGRVVAITAALSQGLETTSADYVSAAWIIGEYLGVTPRLPEYHLLYGRTLVSSAVASATAKIDAGRVTEATMKDPALDHYRMLGRRLAANKGYLRTAARFLYEPSKLVLGEQRKSRELLSQLKALPEPE